MTEKLDKPRHRVGDPLASVLVTTDLPEILNLSLRRVQELELAGDLAQFECLPAVGKRPRYSGKKIQQWLDGEQVEPARMRVFGGARKSR
jgi:hypothetical protein